MRSYKYIVSTIAFRLSRRSTTERRAQRHSTPINRLFTGLNELLENATRDEKEDQIDEKYFLMKSTASNVELLSRHLSISLTTNDSEDS